MRKMLPLFLLLLPLFASVLSAAPSHRILEYNALLSIKAAVLDDSTLSSWANSTNHCNWVGVTCDPSQRHVTVIDVSGFNLSGVIPPEIRRFTRLFKLDVSQNNFSGAIAPEIGICKDLVYIDLSSNQLSGAIPLEITGIRYLRHLNLSKNQLVGGIPDSLGTMSSLISLDLSYNNLSGLVPEVGLFKLLKPSSFLGNPHLCGLLLGPCGPPKSILKLSILVFGVLSATLILAAIIVCVPVWIRMKYRASAK